MSNITDIKGAVIFDLDGTLSDTSGDIVFSANHIREKVGLPPLEPEAVMALVGLGAPFLLSQLTGLDESLDGRFKDLLDEYQAHYIEHQTEHSKLYPGIRELLNDLLEDSFDLYILSNKPHPAVIAEIKGMGIEEIFRGVWGAGSLSALKPDPVGIELAIETSGISRNQTVMVGDMLPDVEVARNAGIESCFVTWGFGSLKPADAASVNLVDTSDELKQAIHDLISPVESSD